MVFPAPQLIARIMRAPAAFLRSASSAIEAIGRIGATTPTPSKFGGGGPLPIFRSALREQTGSSLKEASCNSVASRMRFMFSYVALERVDRLLLAPKAFFLYETSVKQSPTRTLNSSCFIHELHQVNHLLVRSYFEVVFNSVSSGVSSDQ